MKCFTENCHQFVSIMECMGELFSFVQLRFTQKSLIITGTDINRTVFMDLQLHPSFFTQYIVDDQKAIVSLEQLNIILKCSTKQDQLELTLIEDDTVLEVTFLNLQGNRRGCFKISLKEFDTENQVIQKYESDDYLMLTTDILSNSIRHLSHLADNLEIEMKGKRIRFNVKGTFSNGFVEFSQFGEIKVKAQKRYKQIFAFEILLKLCKIDRIEDKVTLFFQSNNNLVIHVDIQNGGELTFHLAPKFIALNQYKLFIIQLVSGIISYIYNKESSGYSVSI